MDQNEEFKIGFLTYGSIVILELAEIADTFVYSEGHVLPSMNFYQINNPRHPTDHKIKDLIK